MDKEIGKLISDSLFSGSEKVLLAKSTAYKTIWHAYVDDIACRICSNVAADIAAWLKVNKIGANQALVCRVVSATPNCYLNDSKRDLEYTTSMKVINILDLLEQNDDVVRYSVFDTNTPKPNHNDRKVCNVVVTNSSGVLLCMQKDRMVVKIVEEKDADEEVRTLAGYFDEIIAQRNKNPVISSYITRVCAAMDISYTPFMSDEELNKGVVDYSDKRLNEYIKDRSVEIGR